MTYDPNLPAEATATFRHKPETAPITVIGTWTPKTGCFGTFPRYYVNGQDVSWPFLDLCEYKQIEAQALAALNVTVPIGYERGRLIGEYMSRNGFERAEAEAAVDALHDRDICHATRPGDPYLALGRNEATGHWEWQEMVVEAELTYGERLSMAEDERFDCMKDDSHL